MSLLLPARGTSRPPNVLVPLAGSRPLYLALAPQDELRLFVDGKPMPILADETSAVVAVIYTILV